MKRNALLCFFIGLCLLFSACATPAPEESSVPAEESSNVVSAPAPEDPNAKAVRAYLEDLLATEWSIEEEDILWLTAERAEAIRESVKQLKAPILTEADVMRIAERALCFYVPAWQRGKPVSLPACGVLADFQFQWANAGGLAPLTVSYEDSYTELLAYTFYLFTPPEYVFRESDVGREISRELSRELFPDALPSWPGFYLALAGAGRTPLQAMETLSRGKNGLTLKLSKLENRKHPLDLRYLEGLTLLHEDGGEATLELLELALQGEVTLPENFSVYTDRQVNAWSRYFSDADAEWEYGYCSLPDGTWAQALVPIQPEVAEDISKLVRLLRSPVLTEETVSRMVFGLCMRPSPLYPILLPGVDGEKDRLLPALGDDTQRGYRLSKYLLDLFTPPDCRYTDLFNREGDYYALDGDGACYAMLAEGHALYLVDGEGRFCSLYDKIDDASEEGLWK